MQGTVVHYNPDTRLGIIYAENGVILEFRGSEWQSPTPPAPGAFVQYAMDANQVVDVYFVRQGQVTEMMLQRANLNRPPAAATDPALGLGYIDNPNHPPGRIPDQQHHVNANQAPMVAGQQPGGGPTSHVQVVDSTAAIVCFIMGILPFVTMLFFPFSIVAVIMGHIARGNIRKSNGYLGGGNLALVGLILGYIGIAIVLIVVLMIIPEFSRR